MQLVYFASPMCSWCWGFSPVIQQIKNNFSKQVEFRLVLGPFRVDSTEVMDESLRDYVLRQCYKVHETTAQSFDYTFQMGGDFVYNTKHACLAIKSLCRQQPWSGLNILDTIQAAFYTKNLNVTHEDVLIGLAEIYKVNTELFIEDLHSSETGKLLDDDFSYCQRLGVLSYPTLIGIKVSKILMLACGFMPYTNIESKVKNWIGIN